MQKKFIILIFAILILFTSAIFVGCGEGEMTIAYIIEFLRGYR